MGVGLDSTPFGKDIPLRYGLALQPNKNALQNAVSLPDKIPTSVVKSSMVGSISPLNPRAIPSHPAVLGLH